MRGSYALIVLQWTVKVGSSFNRCHLSLGYTTHRLFLRAYHGMGDDGTERVNHTIASRAMVVNERQETGMAIWLLLSSTTTT